MLFGNGKQFSGGLTLHVCSALCIAGWRELFMHVGQGLFLFSLFFLLEEKRQSWSSRIQGNVLVSVYQNSVSLPDSK